MSSEGQDEPTIFSESHGEGPDGSGSPGTVEEKNREAEASQANAAAFDFEGDDTDGAGSAGMVQNDRPDQGGASGLASSLQSGGTIPGGGPGTMHGSLGSGGAPSANRASGAIKDWDKGEHEESGE